VPAAYDIMHTFAEILKMTAATDGISFLSELTGKNKSKPTIIYFRSDPETMDNYLSRWDDVTLKQ
jgi:hypothetical protein